jgi:hypothetical protein
MAGERAATVAAGPITFVVEHRAVVQDGVEAGGPTVRVLGSDGDHEDALDEPTVARALDDVESLVRTPQT